MFIQIYITLTSAPAQKEILLVFRNAKIVKPDTIVSIDDETITTAFCTSLGYFRTNFQAFVGGGVERPNLRLLIDLNMHGKFD